MGATLILRTRRYCCNSLRTNALWPCWQEGLWGDGDDFSIPGAGVGENSFLLSFSGAGLDSKRQSRIVYRTVVCKMV